MSYFDELFGMPELNRRENWDGREEAVNKPNTLHALFIPVDTAQPTLHREIEKQAEEGFTDYEIVE